MSLQNKSGFLRAAGESDESLGVRLAAGDALAQLSMPNERDEVWRYVDLDFTLEDFDIAPASSELPEVARTNGFATAGSATVVDGAVVAANSDVEGVSCVRRPGVGESIIPADQDIFTASHLAYNAESVHVAIAAGQAIAAPIVIDVYATADAASFPGIRIEVADGAEATVAIRLRSGEDVTALVVPHVEGRLGANSNLSVVVDQQWGRKTRAIGQVAFRVGRDSSLRLAEAGLGGSLARWQLDINLAGRGSNAQVLGAYFGDLHQILDYRYVMHHAAPNTNSDMFLKGAVEDEAGSIFTGMIRIDEAAQRTNAFQTNRNLILSDGASAQSVPNLEILANDVKCGHGSTVGQLDAEQRYYLMSRGLDQSRADRLQVRGFFEEALARFPIPEMVDELRHRFNEKFIDAQQAGRV